MQKWSCPENIQGAIAGVASEIVIKARYYFDLRRGKIASLQLVARERRGIGHVNPGVEATSRLKMTIDLRTDSDELADRQVASMRGSAAWENQRLAYHSASLGIALEHDQNWFVTAEDNQATILRRMDRGELIAQCNVSVLPGLKKGQGGYYGAVSGRYAKKFRYEISVPLSTRASPQPARGISSIVSKLRVRHRNSRSVGFIICSPIPRAVGWHWFSPWKAIL